MRNGDVVGGEDRDLLVVGLDAMRREHVRAQDARIGERVDAGGSGRSDEHVCERFPGAFAGKEELGLGLALREVRRDRDSEPVTRAVEIERARVRGMRRDAHAHVVGERPAIRSDVGSKLSPRTSGDSPKTSR